jgi:hypothetical protein
MRWVSGKVDRNFRIDLELAGDKAGIFNLWEEKNGRRSSYGYDHAFEDAHTAIMGRNVLWDTIVSSSM